MPKPTVECKSAHGIKLNNLNISSLNYTDMLILLMRHWQDSAFAASSRDPAAAESTVYILDCDLICTDDINFKSKYLY